MVERMRIIFLGTPDFAVASLKALVENKFNVVAVVTAPDKPAGRGLKLQESAVKKYALSQNLPVLQPEKLKDSNFLSTLKSYKADIQVVVAFRMLPDLVWNMPPLGTVNVHGSLLPDYRGAAPIQWAIINGEKESGVTTFKLKHEIDTGDILLQDKIQIGENETAGELYAELMDLGANLLIKTLNQLQLGILEPTPQHLNSSDKHAPKIHSEHCKIDWNQSTQGIFNLIRGLSPVPAAFTFLNSKRLKIYQAEKEIVRHEFEAGSIHSDNKSYLKYACPDGFIHILALQLEGKSRMQVAEFLKGNKITN